MTESVTITSGTGGVFIDVHVQPGARRPGVVGPHGGALKIAVSEPPERGRANAAVVTMIANLLNLPISQVEVVAGHASRRKRLFVRGIESEEAAERIESIL